MGWRRDPRGGPEVEHLLARHPRLQVERFPAYAPELNPDELVWNYLEGELANGSPDTITERLDEMSASRADFAARPPCYARVHRRLRAAVPFFGLNLHGPRSIFVAGPREESAMHPPAPKRCTPPPRLATAAGAGFVDMERQIAGCRILLSVVALFAVAVDPTRPALFPQLTDRPLGIDAALATSLCTSS